MSHRGQVIAVASGKGGTGKTTVATNLAVALSKQGKTVQYLDCDVEEPNGHIFLKPDVQRSIPVSVMVPEIDQEKCNLCGLCTEICEFNALAILGDSVSVFPSLCHGCGACVHVCPESAVTETARRVGTINQGRNMGVEFLEGRLNVGEAMAPPITRVLRQMAGREESDLSILDAPPGTSCPAVEAVRGSDFTLLVTEPTPFGLNDLRLAIKMVRKTGVPCAVVINRSDGGNRATESFCESEGVDILLKIPFDRGIAERYSRGQLILDLMPLLEYELIEMYNLISRRINGFRTSSCQR